MIIFDEKIYAEEVLRKGFKTKNKNVYELNILCRYLFHLGWDEEKVKKRIIKFCEKHIEGFNMDEWYRIINTTISSAKRRTLKTGKEVNITQSELDTITSIEGFKEQKVAFVLLVLYKFYSYNKFSVIIEELYKLAELSTINRQTKLKVLYELNKLKLIDIDMRGKRWVKFADKKGTPIITIKNFDNFIWEYLNYIGEGKFKRCEECKVNLVRVNGRNSFYCLSCRHNRDLMKYRKYNKKR